MESGALDNAPWRVVSDGTCLVNHPEMQQPQQRRVLHPHVIEVPVRPFLYAQSQEYDTQDMKLSDLPTSTWVDMKQRGMHYVWLQGIWKLGRNGVSFDRSNDKLARSFSEILPGWTTDDVIGSPYAVSEYVVNPDVVDGDENMAALKHTINEIGLGVMLDFVPNHTATDSPWVQELPQMYITTNEESATDDTTSSSSPTVDARTSSSSSTTSSSARSISMDGIYYGNMGGPQSTDAWRDTYQLNYWNPLTRQHMIQQLLRVAAHADAIRVDMAYVLLNRFFARSWGDHLGACGYAQPEVEFWEEAITAVKQEYPHVILVAEVYGGYEFELQQLGFDFTYNKRIYDQLVNHNVHDLQQYLASISTQFLYLSAHFVANHDEERIAALFDTLQEANACALATFTLPGMRMHWIGQFEGYKHKLAVHLRRQQLEPSMPETVMFYNKLLPVITSPLFSCGEWEHAVVHTYSGDVSPLIGYRWVLGDRKVICVINFTEHEQSGRIVIPNVQPVVDTQRTPPIFYDVVPVRELLTEVTYLRSVKTMRTIGLTVVISRFNGQLFEYK